jgi:hypothetical protein
MYDYYYANINFSVKSVQICAVCRLESVFFFFIAQNLRMSKHYKAINKFMHHNDAMVFGDASEYAPW